MPIPVNVVYIKWWKKILPTLPNKVLKEDKWEGAYIKGNLLIPIKVLKDDFRSVCKSTASSRSVATMLGMFLRHVMPSGYPMKTGLKMLNGKLQRVYIFPPLKVLKDYLAFKIKNKKEFDEHIWIGGPESRTFTHSMPTSKEIAKELKKRLKKKKVKPTKLKWV